MHQPHTQSYLVYQPVTNSWKLFALVILFIVYPHLRIAGQTPVQTTTALSTVISATGSSTRSLNDSADEDDRFLSRILSDALISTIRTFSPGLRYVSCEEKYGVCYDASPRSSYMTFYREFDYDKLYADDADMTNDWALCATKKLNIVSLSSFSRWIKNDLTYAFHLVETVFFVNTSLYGNKLVISVSVKRIEFVPQHRNPKPLSLEWNEESTGLIRTYELNDCQWTLESERCQWNLKCKPKVMREIERLKRNGIIFPTIPRN